MNLVNFRWLAPLCTWILFNFKEMCGTYLPTDISDMAAMIIGIIWICIVIIATVGTLSIISQGVRLLIVKEEETNIKKLTKEQIERHLETMENLK